MKQDPRVWTTTLRLPGRLIAAVATVLAVAALAACGGEQEPADEPAAPTPGSDQPAASAEAAVADYRAYVVRNAEELVTETDRFLAAVEDGDIERAMDLYTVAHVPFERIEPVAGAFGNLDPALDAREGDVPERTFGGFHYFERALWIDESTEGLAPYIRETKADTERLRRVTETIELTPADIATGAVDLLGEVSASKITGEEERYSHTDLFDFEANVEGSEAAFDAVRPLLPESEQELAGDVEERFGDVYAALDEYRRGDGFVLYTELTDSDTRELSQKIDALAEPLSQVAALVEG